MAKDANLIKAKAQSANNWFNIKVVSIYVAVFIWLNSVFGVAVQKGMVNAMHLGNMRGDYSPQEVFYSTVVGINTVLNSLSLSLIFEDILLFSLTLFAILSIVGFIFAFIYKNPSLLDSVKDYLKDKKQEYFTDMEDKNTPYLLALLFAVFGTLAGLAFAILTRIFVVVLLALLVLPAYLGYITGQRYINDLKDTRPCVSSKSLPAEQTISWECTHLSINKSPVLGKVLLETNKGYFFHLNTAFLYISKDGKICAYSRSNLIKREESEVANSVGDDQKMPEKEQKRLNDIKNARKMISDVCGVYEPEKPV